MISGLNCIDPFWAAPKSIKALCTTRLGGVSKAPFNQFNLGLNAGDDPAAVISNRAILRSALPNEPLWLKQVHGTKVSTPITRKLSRSSPFEADASVTNVPNEVLVILTADCMPVLFTSRAGDVVGAAHAGWRGLSGGVLENTIQQMCALSLGLTPQDILAWMGPAIGPTAFEVGEDVLEAYAGHQPPILSHAFTPIVGRPGKYFANLYLLAQDRLNTLGVGQIDGGRFCTFTDQENFFSYRRDGITGRFGSLIWIASDR
jgi:YfiH family protein